MLGYVVAEGFADLGVGLAGAAEEAGARHAPLVVVHGNEAEEAVRRNRGAIHSRE
jgi:molybdate-binding protein